MSNKNNSNDKSDNKISDVKNVEKTSDSIKADSKVQKEELKEPNDIHTKRFNDYHKSNKQKAKEFKKQGLIDQRNIILNDIDSLKSAIAVKIEEKRKILVDNLGQNLRPEVATDGDDNSSSVGELVTAKNKETVIKNDSSLSKTQANKDLSSDKNDELNANTKPKKSVLDQFAHLHHLEGQLLFLLIISIDGYTSASSKMLKKIEAMLCNAKREFNMIEE